MEIFLSVIPYFHVDKETHGRTDDITQLIGDFCNSLRTLNLIRAIVKSKISICLREKFLCSSRNDNEDTQNLLSQSMMRNLNCGFRWRLGISHIRFSFHVLKRQELCE